MKLRHIIHEANVAAKLKDPKTIKMLGIAMRHDSTLPKAKVAALGPKPDDEKILQLWSELLDASLTTTDYGLHACTSMVWPTMKILTAKVVMH
jgi:hypothetical protein